MRKSMNFIVVLALVVLMVGIVTAQEDTLTVLCTPQEDWCVAMTQAFEAETGIRTSYVRLSSGESLARLRAESSNPEFSVWWGGPADAFIAGAEEGLVDAYESPNLSDIPELYRDAENFTWAGVYVGALGFCSNLEILEELGVEPPTSWVDLLAPELEGFIAMAHPATSGTAFTAFWTIVELSALSLEYPEIDLADMQGMDLSELEGTGEGYDEDGNPTELAVDIAFDYFSVFNSNVLQYTRSGSAPGTLAGQGEIAVAIIFSHDCVKLQEEGFDGILVTTFPEEGTGYEIGGMAIIANGPEPEAARLWYDWALTAEAQEIGASVNSLQLPTNVNAAVSDLAVNLSEINVINYNFAAAGLNRVSITERFDAEIATAPQ